jgi:hypothetical protein
MPHLANTESNREGPPKHEWLFADSKLLPDEETEAAYYWEFGLETPEVVAEVEVLKKRKCLSFDVDVKAIEKWCAANPKPEGDLQRWIEWMRKFRKQFPNAGVTAFRDIDAQFLNRWPEFPSQHWLQVHEGIRSDKKRLRPRPNGLPSLKGDILNPHTWLKYGEAQKFDTVPSFFFETNLGLCCHSWISEFMPPGIRYWRDWKDTTKSPWGFASADRWDELRFVKINWARSDRKLKSDFAEWLKENRPDDRQAYHKSKVSDSRRTTERDSLKSLGAWRLLRHFNGDWKKAADYSERFCTDKRGNLKPLYVEQSEWRDAEKRAKDALSEFSKKVFG